MKTTKRFCRDLRQHKTEITDCHKKEMLKPKKKKREKGTSQATILPHKHKESNDEFADNENYGKV